MLKWIPKILSLIVLWGAVSIVFVYVEPEMLKDIFWPNTYLPMLILLFVSIFYTFFVFIKKLWMSTLIAMTIMLTIVLAMNRIMHLGLMLVILLTLIIESVYIYKRNENNITKNEQQDRGSSI